MTHRHELTDEQWQKLKPMLPPQKPETGRPREDHRRIINGILWILNTGAPWRDLPERYGPWQTVYGRFNRWREQGLWERIFENVQVTADQQGELDWEVHFVDSTIVRAHQDAAGAKKGGSQALGYSRGGFSTKIHVRCEGEGKPMVFILSPGQRHDTVFFEPLMEAGAVNRPGPGRPKQRPDRVVGDKGYSSADNRDYLRRRGIAYTIPRRENAQHRGPFDEAIYRMRNRVERLINRLKQYRRIATRYEKLAENYLAMLHIGSILLWL